MIGVLFSALMDAAGNLSLAFWAWVHFLRREPLRIVTLAGLTWPGPASLSPMPLPTVRFHSAGYILAGRARRIGQRDGGGQGSKGRVEGLEPQLDEVAIHTGWGRRRRVAGLVGLGLLFGIAVTAVVADTANIVARLAGPPGNGKQRATKRHHTEARNEKPASPVNRPPVSGECVAKSRQPIVEKRNALADPEPGPLSHNSGVGAITRQMWRQTVARIRRSGHCDSPVGVLSIPGRTCLVNTGAAWYNRGLFRTATQLPAADGRRRCAAATSQSFSLPG